MNGYLALVILLTPWFIYLICIYIATVSAMTRAYFRRVSARESIRLDNDIISHKLK